MAAVTDAQNASSIASNRLRSARSFASWYDDVSLTFRPLGKGAPSATFYFAVAYLIPTALAKLGAAGVWRGRRVNNEHFLVKLKKGPLGIFAAAPLKNCS